MTKISFNLVVDGCMQADTLVGDIGESEPELVLFGSIDESIDTLMDSKRFQMAINSQEKSSEKTMSGFLSVANLYAQVNIPNNKINEFKKIMPYISSKYLKLSFCLNAEINDPLFNAYIKLDDTRYDFCVSHLRSSISFDNSCHEST